MSETIDAPNYPFVSIVVPALNCTDEVKGFAETIRRQDYPDDRFEVIVVDNGSTDDTFESIRIAGLIAHRRLERGRTRALNTGIKAARGEFVLTTDLSCRPEPHWISAVVETFEAHPEAGCVAGDIKLLKTHDNMALEFQERNNYMSPLLALSRNRLPFLPFADGANASFRRRVFEEIGKFEESFIKAGDVEICTRMLLLSNYHLLFNQSALIWEPGEPSLRALLRQRFRMGIGSTLMRYKYPELYSRIQPKSPQILAGRLWWTLHARLSSALNLVKLNLKALRGYEREAAIDANFRVLIGWFQSYGRIYGRWWLNSNNAKPQRADPSLLRNFVTNERAIRHRIRLVDIPGKIVA